MHTKLIDSKHVYYLERTWPNLAFICKGKQEREKNEDAPFIQRIVQKKEKSLNKDKATKPFY